MPIWRIFHVLGDFGGKFFGEFLHTYIYNFLWRGNHLDAHPEYTLVGPGAINLEQWSILP
jgi:hypothetical protein